ncbi:MAG TPA: YtxH domain-containing protein [Gemmatimonadales bacterium]|nr:YtxH domain-containing protein [Gemmatimonadales bacterium]
MTDSDFPIQFDSPDNSQEGRGGFVALAVLAAAAGAGAAILLAPEEGAKTRKRVGKGLRSLRGDAAGTIAQLQHEIRRRKNQSRREKRLIALAGVLVGAGIAALLAPESGAETRKRLGGTLGRIKVGAVDRIDRLRDRSAERASSTAEDQPVRSVQELGRDPNTVF